MVEGPVKGVTVKKVMEAINKMKLGKAAGPSRSKYGYDNSEWKVWCWSNEIALSESP